MKTDAAGRTRISTNKLIAWSIASVIVFVIAISMVASSSNADPTDVDPGSQSLVTSVVNASVIVFREGLEAVLIFAAITASFLGKRQQFRRPVVIGVASAFIATVITWFIMTAVVGSLPVSEDALLAITGIAAVVILLLVMNWFFHKVYWTDHIKDLNSKKKGLVDASETGGDIKYWGFVALGFTAVYREGFEVVLFLQNLNLVAGGKAVFWGVVFGLAATAVVGFLTFYLHHKLPYKKMLALTGVLLGVVLVVMVGGSARTLQALGIIPTTPLPVAFPDWWARWFEVVPTYETVVLQLLAAGFVVGSYYAAEWWAKEKRRRANAEAALAPQSIEITAPAAVPVAAAVETGAVAAALPAASSVPRPGAARERDAIAGATSHPSAERVLAAASALPELAWRSPQLAGSNAAVRGVERAASGVAAPRTICGHEATTFCGCDARQPVAAAQMHAAPPAVPTTAPAIRPATHAAAFTPRPLFADHEDGVPAGTLLGRGPVFERKPLFGDPAAQTSAQD